MYLSKLELHGFKSFAEPTDLQFDPGLTAIVGPNGCGKSNIVDAVRWVIGEQRPTALRSDKMENVIFNGTADRKPLGMAEVQLTIENNRGVLPTEYSEVTIGRRLFRDGKSEYLMNGTQCRLKDITGLFMDTGMGADAYSVIELKMIDEILSDNAEDRRHMFEEAAGITRYKSRRRQALRKLDNTQADLNRIRDLIDEIGTHVRRLKRQAKKAGNLQTYEARLHELELRLAAVEYADLQTRRDELEAEVAKLNEQAERKGDQQTAAERRLEVLRDTLDTRETKLEERREALQRHRTRVSQLEAEQRLQRERLDRARADRKRLNREQDEAAAQLEQLTDQQQRLEMALQQATPERRVAEQRVQTAKAERDRAQEAAEAQRQTVRELRAEEEAAEATWTERRRELDRATSRLDMLEDEHRRTQKELDELDATADTLASRLDTAEAERAEAQRQLDAARDALADAEALRADRAEALDAARERLRQLERQRDAAASEVELLESIVSSYEDFSDAVQFLAEHGDAGLDDFRTVADVLACDAEARVALDAALGSIASCIVVADADAAQQAIRQLRAEAQGQAAFVVLDRLPDPEPTPALDGATPLREAVRTIDGAYAPLADVLLQHCYLADSLDDAEAWADRADPPARCFARTGEWVDARGLLQGGSERTSTSPVANRLGRREQLEQARTEYADCVAACEKQETEVEQCEGALAAVDVEARRAEVDDAEAALKQAESQYERVRFERESLEERRERLAQRRTELNDELEAIRADVDTLEAEVTEAEQALQRLRSKRADAEQALQRAEAAEREAVDRHNTAHVEAVEARNRCENLERDLERTQERIAEIERRREQRAEQISELETTIEAALDKQSELDTKIEKVRAERAKRDAAVADAEAALKETKEAIAAVEDELRAVRQEREELMRTESKRSVRLAEVKTRTQDLVENIHEDFDVHLPEADIDVPEDFEIDPARAEVKDLRSKVRKLGNVNPLALEEYEEEKERLDFLQEQRDDLEDAEDTLMETIGEINETAATRFDETFEAIRENFSEIFAQLFEGEATARLELDDPDDPLESPINIIAKPRGKRPSTLAQLSSGEKTLTAIALLFAIYLVKPSPFCILDEVDAPLDDANVQRFMNLIRRFEDDTQFILVTHNQRTMALADRMYGITMEEQGISKLVGVEFDEAVAMAES